MPVRLAAEKHDTCQCECVVEASCWPPYLESGGQLLASTPEERAQK